VNLLLQPKKTKYKKLRKGRLKKFDFKSNTLKFGTIGLKTTESGIISARQLEAARQAINRKTKKKGKIWIRVFPQLPITAKPTEVRMGKGKGNLKYWAVKVKTGTIIFELCGISNNLARVAFKTGRAKLSVKTKITRFYL